jgi:hypothetical protein
VGSENFVITQDGEPKKGLRVYLKLKIFSSDFPTKLKRISFFLEETQQTSNCCL